MTEQERALALIVERITSAPDAPATAAAIAVLTQLVEAETARLAGFRARQIPPEQHQAELERVKALHRTFKGSGRAEVLHIARKERLPPSRVRSYLDELKKSV